MTATERRTLREYETAIRRLAWAPKGLQKKRLAELRAKVRDMLAEELKPAKAA